MLELWLRSLAAPALQVLNRGLWSSQPQSVVAVLTKKPPAIMTWQSELGLDLHSVFILYFCVQGIRKTSQWSHVHRKHARGVR